MKKILFTLILLLGFVFTSQAQSEKVKDKATEKVEELNNQIVAGDKSLALSDEQKTQIQEIHVERIMAVRKANKAGTDKEEIKQINKKYFQKIYNEVLTKKQKKARKVGKEKLKD
jgi:1,2-phenylacetyl-CoA epoxidase PaaB subunit